MAFPDLTFSVTSPEYERFDFMNSDDLKSPISKPLMTLARDHLRFRQPGHGESLPGPREVGAIRGFSRSNFDIVEAKSISVERIEDKLLHLAEQQYDCRPAREQ